MTTCDLRCPACGRWLAEVADYARVVCAGCGAEITFKSKAERRRAIQPVPARASIADSS